VGLRYAALRERDGLIPGALVVERNELEWRLGLPAEQPPSPRGHGPRATVCESWWCR
jgi:hypothetical protein